MAQTTATGLPTIGEVIRAWRLFSKLRSIELAEKAGVRSQYLSEIEHNRTANPKEEYLARLADALEVPLQDIYGRRLPPKKSGGERLKRAAGPTPSPKQPAAPLSAILNPAIGIPHSLSVTGEIIEYLIASAHLSEEEEKRIAVEVIEFTKRLLAFRETLGKREGG